MKKHVFYIVMIASLLVFLLPTAANTVIGLDATFRAHPELTFRLLANAIYNALN